MRAIQGVGVVFHFAANPEVRISTIDPMLHLMKNAIATFNLLETVRKCEVKELIFASSRSVYGERKHIPVGESALVRPTSVYGACKATCENLIYASILGLRDILNFNNLLNHAEEEGQGWQVI